MHSSASLLRSRRWPVLLTPPNDGTAIDKQSDALLSSWGAEKLIPLRFVNLLECPTCADHVSYNTILESVTKANQVWKSVGIQFWVRAVERFNAPTFADPTVDEVQFNWWDGASGGTGNAYDELSLLFPGMPEDAWAPDTVKKTRKGWLHAVTAVYAPTNEILVAVCKSSSTSYHAAAAPEYGRYVRMVGAGMEGEKYKLAHELGHFLGLAHTWQGDPGVDPETLAPRKKADRWDLVYKPGTQPPNPHVFYNDFSSAWGPNGSNEANLQYIEKSPCLVHCGTTSACGCSSGSGACGSPTCPCGTGCSSTNCCQCCTGPQHPALTGCDSCVEGDPDNGQLTCHVGESSGYSESYTNGQSQIKGLAAILAGANAVNVMTYRGDWNTHPYFLSESQVHLVRKYLRWDVPISNTESLTIINTDRNTSYSYTPAGRRPMLGSFAFADPLAKLDFNGDGRRDIGVWIPPTSAGTNGQLKVLLSPNFSQSPNAFIDTQFGRLGDMPVPMDFSNSGQQDGRTDFGVYQPGGGADRADPLNTQGYWRWCNTPANPTGSDYCSGISQITCPSSNCAAYGLRGDVPTPGLEFNGTLPNEFSVYRHSNGSWYWYVGGVFNSRAMFFGGGAVPLGGLYDNDSLSDLVIWDPFDGVFYWRRSEQNWDFFGFKQFGSSYASQPSGDAAARAGGLPMPMFRPVIFGRVSYPRRTFAIWRPHQGDWSTVWDPFGTGIIDPPCVYGLNRADHPFSGFDRNGGRRADYGIYRATTYGTSPEIHIKDTLSGSCSGANNMRTCSSCGIRTRVFGVADMTGDGKEEIILIHPDNMTIQWLTSESDYQFPAGGTWVVGNALAQFL